VALLERVLKRMATDSPELIAKSLNVSITLSKGFDKAVHQFVYELRHLSPIPSSEFYWNIPNARAEEVSPRECIQEGPKHGDQSELEITRKQHPESSNKTRLTFKYREPIKQGDQIRLRFSYEAPTSAEFRKRFFVRLGSYAAPFQHTFAIEAFQLNVVLPHEMSFIETIPYLPPPLKGPEVSFPSRETAVGEFISHHVVFCQDRKVLFAVWSLLLLAIGFSMDPLWRSNLSLFKKGVLSAFAAIGITEAAAHTVIVSTTSGIFHGIWELVKRGRKKSGSGRR
jgi:hypothetical protein